MVNGGAAGTLIVRLKMFCAVARALSRTVITIIGKLPAAVGVPLSSPVVELIESPAGSPLADQV